MVQEASDLLTLLTTQETGLRSFISLISVICSLSVLLELLHVTELLSSILGISDKNLQEVVDHNSNILFLPTH